MKLILALFALSLLALGLVGCGGQQPPASDTGPQSGSQSAPSGTEQTGTTPQSQPESADSVELRILDYDGIQDLIASHKGKVVVMDVWATTCGPCIKEFPGLVDLDRAHGSDVACISVSSDFLGIGDSKPQEVQAEVLAFLEKQKATFANVLSSTPDSDLYEKLDIPSIPAVFVYDRDGKLAKRFGGGQGDFTYEKDITPFVEQLLQ